MTFRTAPEHALVSPPVEQRKNVRRAATTIVLILVLGAILRVGVFLISNADPLSRQLEPDSRGYLTLAASLRSGTGFGRDGASKPTQAPVWTPELVRTPGYPVLITFLDALTGHGQTATVLFQHLLSIAATVMATVTCFRFFGPRAAVLAVAMLAFDLQGIALSNLILTEVAYGFILLCIALIVPRLAIEPSWRLAVVTGGLVGVSALIRPTSIALPTVVGLGLALYGLLKRQRQAIAAACLVALVGNAIQASWIVRNGLMAGEYTPSSIGRHNLLLHASSAVARAKGIPLNTATEELSKSLGFTELQIRSRPMSPEESARVRALTIDTILMYKRDFLVEYAIRSINTFFRPDKSILTVLGLEMVSVKNRPPDRPVAANVSPVSATLLGYQVVWLGLLYLLALKTVLLAARDARSPVIIWTCFALTAYVMALQSGFPGEPRLRWPTIPLLTILAAASSARVSALRDHSAPAHRF